MGAGGGVLESGFVFKMIVEFKTTEGTPTPVDLSGDPMYKGFVDAINNLVYSGEWIEASTGGIVLLRGPIESTADARQLNLGINRVLRGLRVRQNGESTGVSGRVVKNQGPVLEADKDKDTGKTKGANQFDNDWSAPAKPK